jgi:hypothetical protein
MYQQQAGSTPGASGEQKTDEGQPTEGEVVEEEKK